MKKCVVRLEDGRKLIYYIFHKNISINEVSQNKDDKELKKCQS